jgi:hypothetical protein
MLNGESFYNGIANFDIVTGIIGLLHALFEKGWSPRCTVLPVAIWQPRVHNALPDFLANCAIDNENTFELTHPDFDNIVNSNHFFVQCRFDGAFRASSNLSAAAFVVTALQINTGNPPSQLVIDAQSSFIRHGVSAFNSEAIAVYNLLRKLVLFSRSRRVSVG